MSILKNIPDRKITRRALLKYSAIGVVSTSFAGSLVGCSPYSSKPVETAGVLPDEKEIGKVDSRTDKVTGSKISLLGFGCMRFPKIKENKPEIDEPKAQAMVDFAIAHGINYFDTAWPYHEGLSETFIGKALKKYPRDSFYLADKMPTWLVNNRAEAKDIFEKQLDKCQTNYFDYYLLHALGKQEDYDTKYEAGGVLAYLKEEKAAGRIRNLGFSFHGDVPFMKYLLAKHSDWDFVQIQLNYLDWDDDIQRSGELYKLLTDAGIQVIVMEPVKGGTLATLNPNACKILKDAEPDRSVASWAVRFCASLPNVLTILSGMSNKEQVKDNIYTCVGMKALTDDDRKVINQAVLSYRGNKTIDCTGCGYCMDCPYGVNIPKVFLTYNAAVNDGYLPDVYGSHDEEYEFKRRKFITIYDKELNDKQQAHRCIQCRKCIPKCPQGIRIPDNMEYVASVVDKIKG